MIVSVTDGSTWGVYVSVRGFDKGRGGGGVMYTLKNAATVLRVSVKTIRQWIAKDNIETTVIETDRRRRYLSYNDVLALADKHRPQVMNKTDRGKGSQDMTGLYSMEDVAKILGLSYTTVKKWIKDSKTEKKFITTDRMRVYVSYNDIVALAGKHNRTIAHANVTVEQDSHAQEDKLYTVADASLFLGVTEGTVKEWLSLYNIETKTLEADKQRIYIAYGDLIKLAHKQNRQPSYPVDIITNIKEIRSRLEQIETSILNLEKYIKRSIYLGK